jgi:hypothetical protein
MDEGSFSLCLDIDGHKCVFLGSAETRKWRIEFVGQMAIGLCE